MNRLNDQTKNAALNFLLSDYIRDVLLQSKCALWSSIANIRNKKMTATVLHFELTDFNLDPNFYFTFNARV